MKKAKKFKIGVIGEDYENDAIAFCTLLSKRTYENIQFIALSVKGVTANNVEAANAVGRRMKAEIAKEGFKYIICIKDLDDTLDNYKQVQKKDVWFSAFKKTVGKSAKSYLAIAEIEALLLADVEIINNRYGTALSKHKEPMLFRDPKKEIVEATKKIKPKDYYQTNHCNDLMQNINFQNVYDNHKGERSFQAFIDELDKMLIEKF